MIFGLIVRPWPTTPTLTGFTEFQVILRGYRLDANHVRPIQNYCETCCSSKIFEVFGHFQWFSTLFFGLIFRPWPSTPTLAAFSVFLVILRGSGLVSNHTPPISVAELAVFCGKFSRFCDFFSDFRPYVSGHNPVDLLWRHSRCSWSVYEALQIQNFRTELAN